MTKRMRYDNARFASDFATNFPKLGVDTQEEAGEKLGVSQNAIHSWLKGRSFPQKDKWKVIAENLGIDPSDYRVNVKDGSFKVDNSASVTNSHTTTNGHNVAASSGAKVSIGSFSQGEDGGYVKAELTELEYDTLMLFRKYGNAHLLEKCRATLLKAQEIFE